MHSTRLELKVRRLIALAEQMLGNAERIADCCYQLLNVDRSAMNFVSGASCLNNDSVPLQLCLIAGKKGTTLRIIADPGANCCSTEARYKVSMQTLWHALEINHAQALAPLVQTTIDCLLPHTEEERSAYKQGFVWIAASPEQLGLAFYLEMAPQSHQNGWQAAACWLAKILELFLELNSIISMCSKLFLGSKALPESKTSIQ